ncbi:MAG: hypothetical protein HYZ15_01920 [Sphingobacteriales bacterium]|nr:hypothetical protein [Sphingobacteriales bacterium]
MRKILSLVLVSTFIAGILSACSKGGGTQDNGSGGLHVVTENDTIPPVLEITTPVSNQAYASGSTISITGKISDDLGLYRGSIRITNDATGEVLKEQLFEIHGVLLYNFNVAYVATATAVTDYTVSVFFEDHGLNNASRSLKVKVNP